MTGEIESEDVIRQYLLGRLPEDELKKFEERILTDKELFNRVLLAEDDLVEEYLEDKVPEHDRKAFETSFLSTPEGRRQLNLAAALKEYASNASAKELHLAARVSPATPWRMRVSVSSYFRSAAAAVIVLGLAVVIWRLIFYQSEVERGMAEVSRAYRTERPLEANISGFGYTPFQITRGNRPENVDQTALDRAERILLDEVHTDPSPAALHAIGRLFLAERKFDRAIEQFVKALNGAPNNPQFQSDLGAAYLERSSGEPATLSIGDLATSLELVNRALKINTSLLAARFNKALCLQRMNATTAAKEAWQDYIWMDPNSEWSKEAERNLRMLQGHGLNFRTPQDVLKDFFAVYRQRDDAQAWRIQSQTKEMITGIMIPFQLARELIRARLSNQPDAVHEIEGAFKFVGLMEKQRSGDAFFAELADFYSVARKKNAAVLKRAQDALHRGYQLCLQGHYAGALPFFEDAQDLFRQAGNTWESKVVDYWRAYCLSYRGELKKSSALLLVLADDCQKRRYHWLGSLSYCWLANNAELLGEYSQGADLDNKALRIAEATADSYAEQKSSSQIADRYKFFGRLREALEFNQRSLPSADTYFVSCRQFWRSLFSTTDTLFALHLYSAAEAYQREALLLALNQFNDAALTHSTYRRLGQIYAGQENYEAAAQALDLSLNVLESISNDPISRKLGGLSILEIAAMKRQKGDYMSALESYHKAAREFDSSEFVLHNYSTHKGMLLCYLFNKDHLAIQQEMPTVFRLFEENRQRIKEEQNRNSFFDVEQDIYELAIEYEYDRNNKEQSFYYAELSRARSLQHALAERAVVNNNSATTDAASSAVSKPLGLAQLKERLPAELQVIEYSVLRDRLLIWVVTKTNFEVVELPVSRAALEAISNEYLYVLSRNDPNSIEREKQLAVELHGLLLAPVEHCLNKSDEVAVVPDKFLFKVPYSALLSHRSGDRLVNDYTLLYAPSASVLVLCSEQAQKKTQDKEIERLLSVGNPLTDRQRYPDLPDLPSATLEAKKVGSFYLTRAVFTREEALKEDIESELRQSDVIHFAAHYLPDAFSTDKSRLLLTAKRKTKTDEADDYLSLEEIQSMRLLKAKLVILSACQSGVERYYAGEGLIGLSRAFLVAGVPLVLATHWSVESDSTADLMIEFHRLRKVKNMATTVALRQAQLAMLSGDDERYRRPYYWAGFFAIGGHALY